jgi:hypothetical protein
VELLLRELLPELLLLRELLASCCCCCCCWEEEEGGEAGGERAEAEGGDTATALERNCCSS